MARTHASDSGGLLAAAVDRWSGFWFQPQPMTPLGLVRICYGLVMVAWTSALLPDLLAFFGTTGIQPEQESAPYAWGPLQIWHSDQAMTLTWAVLLLSSAALAVGWHSRLAALVVFVCLNSFIRRDIYVFNAGDGLLRIECLFLLLSPAGAALSLDSRRRRGSFWAAQVRAPWALRLFQVQMSIVYLATVREKLSGQTWNEGTAVSYALRLYDVVNITLPQWVVMNPLLMNAATWAALAVEIALGVLVWHRRLRPWVLGAGVVLHLSILVTLAVGFFSWSMFVLYVAFVSPEAAQRLVDRVRRRLDRRAEDRPGAGTATVGSATAEPVTAEPATRAELVEAPDAVTPTG
ncbi:MAG TPA: HTTM domain-containing protein [Mycobacteriales bacterium]|nr:HTTM domain-containing protein [Mycobacteriales bacterium]